MSLLAIIILVVVGLIVVIGSIRKRKLLINKGVVIIVIIAIGLFVFDSHFNNKENENLARYQQIAPNIVDAPYMLITETRTYYVAEWYINDQYFTLQRFWFFDQDEWEIAPLPLLFDKSIPDYSDLNIVKRGG